MDDGDTRETAFLPYRPLVAAAVAFACGILARETLTLPSASVWAGLAVAVGAFPIFAWLGAQGAASAMLCLAMAGAGWVRLDVANAPHGADHISRFLSGEPTLVKLRGVAASDVETRVLRPMPLSGDSKWLASEGRQTRFDLDCEGVFVDGHWRPVSGRVRVVEHEVRGDPPYGYRYRVVVVGTARLPCGPTNPGQIDGATLLRRRGIDATLSVGEGGVTVEGSDRSWSLWGTIYSLRSSLRRKLQTTLAPDRKSAALLCALVLGDRTEVDDDLEEAFARTGTIHLLAVSGFNVGVVAWVVWLVTGLVGVGRRLSGAVVLVVVVGYTLITGAPPSAVRAAVMTGGFVVAILARRQGDPVQGVALAAVVLLVLRPFDLFSVGFQLSFVAVLGIILLTEGFARVFRPGQSLFERIADEQELGRVRLFVRVAHRKAAGGVAGSLAAWLAVFPLTAWYFHLFSPIILVVNLLAVPVAGALTLLGFVHVIIAATLPVVGAVPALASKGLSWSLMGTVTFADWLPMAWEYCPAPSLGWVVAYYAVGLLVVSRHRLGLSGTRAATLWVAGILAFLVLSSSGRPPEGLELTALDVQHGNATVLRFPDGSTVLYDCGSYGRTDVGRWSVAPALWHWGVRTIDLLVVSHADADHVNGIPSLLDRFKIGRVVHSPVLERAEAGRQLIAMLDRRCIPHQPVKAGDRIVVGEGNVIDVLSPTDWLLGLRPNDQNENSLVVRVEHAGRRVLLCGDIQQFGSTVLLHSGLDLRADVLVAPHHGCANPLSEALARAICPAYVLCSNRSDHLPPASVAAYESAGARVLATCWDGAITVTIRDGNVEAAGWKKRAGPGRPTLDPGP